ncbi:MAG: helix-turn-helix transcriptional regulator [Oscillospiraceae bacterium]|nr:helix-turn-helix transcriptional regulator [Oscillospiraceae bacterium]
MKITGNENEQAILKELGTRVKQYRISLNITQADLAAKCGISSSTVVRLENGIDSKFSNYIKILNGLRLTQNIDMLIPEMQPDFKALFEQKAPRQRVKSRRAKPKSNWVWGEDKR